ncbi:hypothetical protein [Streptomyces iconiensis]|uniref:Integral membrane protein n=1 Tax=Streptomyces iconiensis TaxID=1384038 RepID=A0ABT6ZX44_9ACTN|nr:hypothetical protein [Streptomyces iconiensis]MDJ1133374.1 hypothetical protein [Streptomyces iconiensis]
MVGTVRSGQPGERELAYGVRELLRAELAGRELAARTALLVGVCAGAGFVASGIYDHVHAGRPDGTSAKLSLVIGAATVAAACALLVLLGLRSRDRQRRLAAYGGPGNADQRALRGLRAAWISLSTLALALAFLFLAAGLVEASKTDPYEEPDPTLYGTFLLWAAVLTAAGCTGMRKARRNRPGTGTGWALRAGAVGPGAIHPGGDRPGAAHLGKGGGAAHPRRVAPADPRAALFGGLGSEPAAPHRLSTRLSARLRTVSRARAVVLAVAGALLGCGLTGVTAFSGRAFGTGEGLFWTLTALTALYLLALLLELAHYGPRRRYLVLVVFTGIALVGIAWSGFSTSALLDRGRWVTVEVTEVRHQAKGGPRCELRTPGGTPGTDGGGLSLSPCDGAAEGDRMRVFHDPAGETDPRRSEPLGLTGFYAAWGTASAVLVTTATLCALHGHRRRGELGLNRL